MKNIAIICLLLALATGCRTPMLLEPVKVGEKWGFANKRGEIVIGPQFDDIESVFCDGLAAVKVGEKYGFIDKSGTMVIKPQFDGAHIFIDGMARVWIGGKCGFIDKSGEMVIKPQFDDAYFFQEGRAGVKIGEKWGYVDTNGKVVIQPQYDDVFQFDNGVAKVLTGRTPSLIDRSGMRIHNATLLEAVEAGNLAEVRAFLEKGADVNAVNKDGETPIFMAIIKKHEQVADLLRQHGAKE